MKMDAVRQTVASMLDAACADDACVETWFEGARELLDKLGFSAAAVYFTDAYPDRMRLVCRHGDSDRFPSSIVPTARKKLDKELAARIGNVPGLQIAMLSSKGLELGALAALPKRRKPALTDAEFAVIAKTLSIMAYIERLRDNNLRERQEKDLFFAQALTNRLLISRPPEVKNLRIGFRHVRSLAAGGDFFDFIPTADGGLAGFIGCCNGDGLRTVMEVTSIMRVTHRACNGSDCLRGALLAVNDFLVKEKKRAHQASLCLFRVDMEKRQLHLVKSGCLGILLSGPDRGIINSSTSGSMFLGMVPRPKVRDETYDFIPGSSLFCVTEGFYTAKNFRNEPSELHGLVRTVGEALERKRRPALANAVFERLENDDTDTPSPRSMLAISIEHTGA